MNVHVNENCIACGLCAAMCPAVFSMSDDGYAAARDEIFPDQHGLIRETAESCPVNAIELTQQ